MNLKFTARSVANAEKESGLSVLEMVKSQNLFCTMLLVREGLGMKPTDEDLAYEFIDTWIAEDPDHRDSQLLLIEIMKVLKKNGFLAIAEDQLKDIEKKALASFLPSGKDGKKESKAQ